MHFNKIDKKNIFFENIENIVSSYYTYDNDFDKYKEVFVKSNCIINSKYSYTNYNSLYPYQKKSMLGTIYKHLLESKDY